MFLYCLAMVCSFISNRLPPKFGYLLACLIADIVYLVWSRGRARLKENMTHVLGNQASEEEIKRAARGAFRNYGKYVVDFLRSPLLQAEDIESKVSFQSLENLDQALGAGKGGIIVGLHLGNWDLAATAISLHRYRLNAIDATLGHIKLNQFAHNLRTRIGMKLIPAREGIGAMIQALRRNELLALLIDLPRK